MYKIVADCGKEDQKIRRKTPGAAIRPAHEPSLRAESLVSIDLGRRRIALI
jgi:hypothetical protein